MCHRSTQVRIHWGLGRTQRSEVKLCIVRTKITKYNVHIHTFQLIKSIVKLHLRLASAERASSVPLAKHFVFWMMHPSPSSETITTGSTGAGYVVCLAYITRENTLMVRTERKNMFNLQCSAEATQHCKCVKNINNHECIIYLSEELYFRKSGFISWVPEVQPTANIKVLKEEWQELIRKKC